MNCCNYKSPFGSIILQEENGVLTMVKFGHCSEQGESALLQETSRQLDEYFSGKRKEFDLPHKAEGTLFQQKVWQALQQIPYGTTVCYKDIAEAIGSPKACRAVGMANHNNPICIIVPCHRVIGANGSLVGYAEGLDVKQKLLKLEAEYARI